ncbi:uncharacterized protein BXIN_1869 [Babesia sp. Xinjiang]|uniref:uncharacterized protein n=1 Tax=Babesia sp. Xinjiang TaxID=462227 RepID=UPI000A24DDE6|nr:uncharacterized protein BXIN_1869 [Babesia sp. Xinjiang]ORM40409.1 hypothetical protein BXIN_1869 [Babesia sp. Xinjiang]
MLPYLWTKWILICTIAVVLAIYKVRALQLELNASTFPASVEIYEGTFGGGGKYRLFQSVHPPIDIVTYRGRILGRNSDTDTLVNNTIIQEYKCNGRTIISVSRLRYGVSYKVYTTCYEIIGHFAKRITRRVKNNFVTSPISLPMDPNADKFHPFINSFPCGDGIKSNKWSIIRSTHKRQGRHKLSYLRDPDETFHISPLINIDGDSQDPNFPPSSISSQSTKIYFPGEPKYIQIWNSHSQISRTYILHIPQIEDGTFKPGNIVSRGYKFSVPSSGDVQYRPIRLTVNISNPETTARDIVVMANLKRGCWLYTQYSILPLRDQKYIYVNVVNFERKCDIYHVTPDAFVTHVEVFNHTANGAQYVVVNVKKRENDLLKNIKKVYKLVSESYEDKYVDVSSGWDKLYVDMLYTIYTVDNTCQSVMNSDFVTGTSSE